MTIDFGIVGMRSHKFEFWEGSAILLPVSRQTNHSRQTDRDGRGGLAPNVPGTTAEL